MLWIPVQNRIHNGDGEGISSIRPAHYYMCIIMDLLDGDRLAVSTGPSLLDSKYQSFCLLFDGFIVLCILTDRLVT